MKRIYFFCSLLLSLLLTSCGDYDDSAIQNKLNDFKERITALQTKANKLNEDISKLSYLTEGNVITSVTRMDNMSLPTKIAIMKKKQSS